MLASPTADMTYALTEEHVTNLQEETTHVATGLQAFDSAAFCLSPMLLLTACA